MTGSSACRTVSPCAMQLAKLIGVVVALVATLALSSPLQAADLSRDIREGRSEGAGHGGYLEIGIGASYGSLPVVGAATSSVSIQLGGHYDWNGFFIDVLAESFSGFQLGYNFYSDNFLSFDFLAAVTEVSIDSDLSADLDSLRKRDPGLNGGIRATFYQGSNLFQFELLADATNDHGGHVVSFFGGRSWLHNNWNIHAILGGRYWSAETLDYVVGVTEEESSRRFPAYRAKSGTSIVAELGVTYPISEHWVFRGTLSQWMLTDSIADSPFITDDRYTSAVANLYFVY